MTFTVDQSNLFAVQCDPGQLLHVTQSELEQFVGCCMYMSIFNLPRSEMYWASNTRISQVADVMTWVRWKAIKKNLHFNDNTHMPSIDDPKRDKLFKIKPLLQILQQQILCIDEQIVPFKGRSSLKQYVPKKPHKWGYKIFMLCDTHGMVHNFEIYTGKILPVEGYPDLGANSKYCLEIVTSSSTKYEPHLLLWELVHICQLVSSVS